ncbi:putative outer membrane starch-binding protein [Larkinella arboricola]|uniref:Putative outer membrane starch-binding protein n=1 Tax=Larkinella arboricola TaxID=643671 RepID=A0A327WMG9_LARAB|nr:RagB/SusD family nutrient uptake outer membrane protein [Larkinella arboricola]RAJ93203.1 putative outer membrane starch-binding protein [Larkinella arboricola]
MKIISKINIALACCIALLSGCSLEPELTDVYGEEVAWSSEANLELSLNKFYPLIGQTYYTPHVNQDAYSDILKMNTPSADQNRITLGSAQITPGENPLGNWEWGYTWIRNCNEFLDGMQTYGGKLPEATRLRAEAEVRFFRAYVNFELAKRYGASIILFDRLPDGSQRARNNPEEVWSFIAADLDFAAQQLPLTVPGTLAGKLTKGAALGLKARTMLYAQRWKVASDAVAALEALGLYDLHPDYEKLFQNRRSQPVENKESILEFGYSSPNFGYSFDYFFCPPGDKGYSQISPTDNLVSAYQMADGTDFSWSNPAHAAKPYVGREPRFYASILYHGASWKGRTIDTRQGGVDGYAVGGGTTSTGYYMRKFFDGSVKTQDTGFQPGELTFYFMRYAEVLLIKAEALAEQGNLSEALAALNRVRARAGFKEAVTAGSKEEFMRLLRHERMIELAFEGHRFWDLRRWDLAKTELNGISAKGRVPVMVNDSTTTYREVDADNGRKRVYLPKYNRFPIPSVELQRNALIQQFDEWK